MAKPASQPTNIFAIHLIRDAKACHIADGFMSQEQMLHLCGVYLLASFVDDFLDSAYETEIAIGFKLSQVTCSKEAVHKSMGVGIRAVHVAIHYIRPLEADFTGYPDGVRQ